MNTSISAAARIAKRLTAESANMKDYLVRTKNNMHMREVARTLANGKGYFIGTPSEIQEKFGVTLRPGQDSRCIWGISWNKVWKRLDFVPAYAQPTFNN